MKTGTEYLTQYAEYHRDRRNLATHFVGIPMIVVAIAAMLGALHPYVAWGASAAAVLFYLRLDAKLGLAMLLFNTAATWAGLHFSLFWGIGLFAVGWVFQFIGHWFEGKKPAFVDDLIGLLIGPMFVVAELGFAIGLRRPLLQAIEAKAGATR